MPQGVSSAPLRHSKHLEKLLVGVQKPGHQNNGRPCEAHDATEDLDVQPAVGRCLEDGSADGGHGEGGDRDGQENHTKSVADLGQGRHRDRKSAGKTYEGP